MKYIQTKRFRLLSLLLLFAGTLFAQSGKIVSPTILYSGTPREYYIFKLVGKSDCMSK